MKIKGLAEKKKSFVKAGLLDFENVFVAVMLCLLLLPRDPFPG
jgi:hypothetical protein